MAKKIKRARNKGDSRFKSDYKDDSFVSILNPILEEPKKGSYETELSKKISEYEQSIALDESARDLALASLNENHEFYTQLKNLTKNITNDIYDVKDQEDVESSPEHSSHLFFDFENNVYFDGIKKKMPSCFLGIDGNVYICHPKGIYINNRIYSASKLFLSEKTKLNSDFNYLKSFELILDKIISSYSIENRFSYLCMLPESVDLFNTKVRKCLNTSKGKIISIPKSVALSYWFIDLLNFGDKYCVVNLDGLHPVVTRLSIGQDEFGNKIVQREGIIKKTNIEYDEEFFSSLYLRKYSDKYTCFLTNQEIDRIIGNKDLHAIINSHESFWLYRSNAKINIEYDEEVFQECLDSYSAQISIDQKEYTHIIIAAPFTRAFDNTNYVIADSECAFQGLNMIRNILCKDQNTVIWKEMLPKITLEVIDDATGRFKKVDLIDTQAGQNISLSLDEEYEVSSPGTIILQKGKKEYFLPLEREIYADDINSEKEAYFYDKSFPYAIDLPVELVVKYNYFSDSPIKIYAKPKVKVDKTKEICNSWVDPHIINIYDGPIYKGHPKNIGKIYKDKAFYYVGQSFLRFYSGNANLNDSMFENNIVNEVYHVDMKPVESMYRFVRIFFDSANSNDELFTKDYTNLEMTWYYEQAYKALRVEASAFISDKHYLNGYSQANINKYKKGINRLLSDTIVASWYHDKTNPLISMIYSHLALCNSMKVLTRLSRCIVKKEDDIFNVFETLTSKLCDYFGQLRNSGLNLSTQSHYAEQVRTLSANCWFCEDWIYMFYDTKNGPQVIDDIITMIANYLKSGNLGNDKKYRDVMELLVCISRLRSIDKNLFNPNNEQTKTLLEIIKNSYEKIESYIAPEKLVSRLETDPDIQGPLFGYPNYIYMIIMTLSGEGQVNLVGYHDD